MDFERWFCTTCRHQQQRKATTLWPNLGHLLMTLLEEYSLHGQNFEQRTLFISLEEEMVRSATTINPWAPASTFAGWCGFGNNLAGKSVLTWSGRTRGKKKKKLTSVKGDLDRHVDRMTHPVGGISLYPIHPIISQWTHAQSGHSNRDSNCACAS